MLQGNELRYGGAEGELRQRGAKVKGCQMRQKLTCFKVMCLGTGMPKVSLGKGVPKMNECQKRHKACMLQGNMPRHGSAEGELRH
ncbi:hypothetical protein Pyn_15918 [Prunus yedoensis var. nudiflora]|uniref:Uncharacterized protein n=1 Tax=Prunus yedoensis var. nudiflora TaxID=2094558 RepID=A0A314ZFG6_PRUYE|nr:hypothetical protein Pyn_15918 [Prunus yedoensis var. nudiflora]